METRKNEIICISSDEDENPEQSEINKKQESVIKVIKDNYIFHTKDEVFSGDKKVKVYKRKRKASDTNSDDSCFERNSKAFVCKEENNVKAYNMEEEKEKEKNGKVREEKTKEENKTLLKPKLVVKERKSISSVEQDIFPMFISLCLQKDRSEDMKVIVNKLKRRYEQLNPTYANSEAFLNFLNEKRNDIISSKSKLYIYIAEVMNEMKNSCKGRSTLLVNGKDCSSGGNKLNRNNNLSVPSAACPNTRNSVVNTDNKKGKTNMDNKEEQEEDYIMQSRINIILKTMKKCEKRIKALEESEMDFDDENNSNYIKLEKYKYRMVELYNKYCEYTGESIDAGRQYLRPKHFSTTGIVTVDHAITSFINSKISNRNKSKKIGTFTKTLIFPDYSDILSCVTKCNETHNLGLDSKKQQQIAEKAFIDLGEHLQRCRRNDYWDTFSLFLENKEDDPALKDSTLAEKLMQNKKEGEKRLSNIFEEYVKKQEEMKDQTTDSKTLSENEEDEEDSMEYEVEDDNEQDDDNEIDITLDINKDKSSSDEDENSTDGSETSTNETNTKVKPNTNNADPDIIEIDETLQTEVSDRLKNNDADLKSVEINDNVNMSNCKSNFKSGSISSADTEITISTNNKILIDRTKEEQCNIMSEDPTDNDPLKVEEDEAEEKPLLRVRSFAKPPTTWKDVQEKVDEIIEGENTSEMLTDKDVIDLTQESPKENSTVYSCATTQVGSKVLPIVKSNYKTLVIPAGKSIINVKNITNNYVRLNTKSTDSNNVTKLERGQSISPQRAVNKSAKSTTIHPSANQEMNAAKQAQNSQTKQKVRTVQISQSNQIIILPVQQEKSTLQRPKTNSSASQSK